MPIVVITDYGIIKIPFLSLPGDLQKKYGYIPPAPVAIVTPSASPSTTYVQPTATPVYHPAVADNGSYYGELNKNGVPKTVEVHGYYRKDGTYVRGHYRSAPGSNK